MEPHDRSEPAASAAPLATLRYAVDESVPAGSYNQRLDAGAVLNATGQIWRDDLGRLVGISAIPYAVFIGVAMVLGAVGFGLAASGAMNIEALDATTLMFGGVCAGVMVLAGLVWLVSINGSMQAADELLRGEPRTLGVWSGFLAGVPALGRMVLGNVVFTALILALFAPAAASLVMELWVPGVLLSLLGMVGMVFLGLRLAVMFPVLVVEQRGVIDSMRRSVELTQGRSLEVFLSCFVFGLVLFGVQMVVGVVGLIPLLGMLVQLGAGLLLAPLYPVFSVVLYGALVSERR